MILVEIAPFLDLGYGSAPLGLKIVGRCLTCGRPARRPPPRVSRWGEAHPFPPDQVGCDQDGGQVDQVDCDQEAKLTKLTKLTRLVVINVLTKLVVIKTENKLTKLTVIKVMDK